MSTFKTVTGYALTLIVVLALVVGACGIDDNADLIERNAPSIEEPAPIDDVDEYSFTEEQILGDMVDGIDRTWYSLNSDAQVDTCFAINTYPEATMDAYLDGFRATAPDEVWFLVSPQQVKRVALRHIEGLCMGVPGA